MTYIACHDIYFGMFIEMKISNIAVTRKRNIHHVHKKFTKFDKNKREP